MATPGCDFCDEFLGGREDSFHRVYEGDPGNRVLFQSEQFAVIPSLGQIAEGYLLILPRAHFKAIGDLSALRFTELNTILKRVGEVLKDQYGRYIIFEHGTRSADVGGCGIYHAHLHAVPIGTIADPVAILKSKFPFQELASFDELGSRSCNMASYLFYCDLVGCLYLFDTGPLSSQYMRKLLADALHEEKWDWRTAGREERLLATIERLSPGFTALQRSVESHVNG